MVGRHTLFSQQGGLCFYCEEAMTLDMGLSNSCTRDHRTPLSRGGANTVENIVGACYRCNHWKRDLFETEFRSMYQRVGWPAAPQFLGPVKPWDATMQRNFPSQELSWREKATRARERQLGRIRRMQEIRRDFDDDPSKRFGARVIIA